MLIATRRFSRPEILPRLLCDLVRVRRAAEVAANVVLRITSPPTGHLPGYGRLGATPHMGQRHPH